MNEDRAFLLGSIYGDGSVTNRMVRWSLPFSDAEFASRIDEACKNVYGKKPKRYVQRTVSGVPYWNVCLGTVTGWEWAKQYETSEVEVR
jgi:hypothetical protein